MCNRVIIQRHRRRDRVDFDVGRQLRGDDRFPPPPNRGDISRKSSWTPILKGYDVSDPAWAATSHSLSLSSSERFRSIRGLAKAAVAFPRNNDLSSPTFLARVVPIPQFSEERRGARACDEILIAERRSVGRAEDFRRNWKRNGKWRDACWNRRPRSHRERRSEIRSDGCSFVEQRSLREFLRSLVIGLKSNSNVFQLSSDSYTMFNQLSKIIQLSLSLSLLSLVPKKFQTRSSSTHAPQKKPLKTTTRWEHGTQHTERERERVASATTIIDPRWTRSRIPVQSSRRILHPGQAAVSLSLAPPSPLPLWNECRLPRSKEDEEEGEERERRSREE